LLGRRRFRWVDGLSFAAAPGLHGATANLGVGLAEPGPMSFTLHFLRPGDVVLDVGANVGSYALLAASRGASVLAFEPNPHARRFIHRSLVSNGLSAEVLPLAAGATAERLPMNFAAGATARIGEGSDLVDVVTLDSKAPAEVTLLKVDVEGHEAAVLEGGHRTLRAAAAAIVETWGEPRLHATIEAAGLRPVTYDPSTRALAPLRPGGERPQSVLFVRDLADAQQRCRSASAFRLGRRRY
jgi:FkbM family methyltransferase